MIETSMICLGEGDHKFTSSLVAPVNTHTRIRKPRRVHQSDELEEQVGLSLEQIGRFTFDRSLEFLGIVSRNAVPRLGLAPVH